MTAPPVRADDLQELVAELSAFLGPQCFPATYDHLAASLIRRRAPSHLLWHLSVLPLGRQFASLDEVIEHLSTRAPQAHSGGGTDWL